MYMYVHPCMYVCACMSVCRYVWKYVYVCACMYVCICMYLHACMPVWMCMHACVHVRACICLPISVSQKGLSGSNSSPANATLGSVRPLALASPDDHFGFTEDAFYVMPVSEHEVCAGVARGVYACSCT